MYKIDKKHDFSIEIIIIYYCFFKSMYKNYKIYHLNEVQLAIEFISTYVQIF